MNLQEMLFLLAGAVMVLALVPAILLFRERTVAARLLAIALLVAAANIFHALVISPNSPSILFEPLQFLLPPLFAAYVRALFQTQWRPKPSDLLHFLPFTLMGLCSVYVLALQVPASIALVISLSGWGFLLIQAIIYIGRAINRIRSYRLELKREKSNLTGIDPMWLWRYSFSLHLLYLGYLIIPALLIHLGNLEIARHVISLLMAVAIGYLAFHQILSARLPPLDLPQTPHIQKSGPSYDPQLPGALTLAMDERKLYRNPDLDLSSLAATLGWQRNEVSAAINGHFKCNFYDFINAYRVEESKSLLADPANAQLTFLALGLQAGFNSKPTFNAVFKKMTGLSPSAWQKNRKLV